MTAGPVLFARFAYPPNVLRYCGPDEHHALLEYASAGVVDGGLRELAHGFEGAWPYLELIAGANGIADPLDTRVVEAYWIGNPLLERVTPRLLAASMEERFRGPAGRGWPHIAAEVFTGARPNHAFHVFAVYPWVGLLRTGATDHALEVLDRCRIRWGRVVALERDQAVVRSRVLRWDGRALTLGPPGLEHVTRALDGYGLVPDLATGDRVALHWDWICERLDARQLRSLRACTLDQLDVVNRRAPRSAPATVLS